MNHISEALLEGYAVNVLSRFKRERLEAHLRSCSVSRDRLVSKIEFAEAMNGAAAKVRCISGAAIRQGQVTGIEVNLPLPVGIPLSLEHRIRTTLWTTPNLSGLIRNLSSKIGQRQLDDAAFGTPDSIAAVRCVSW